MGWIHSFKLIRLCTLTNGCISLDVKLVFSKVQDTTPHCILNWNPPHRDFSKKPRFGMHLFPPKKASMVPWLTYKNKKPLWAISGIPRFGPRRSLQPTFILQVLDSYSSPTRTPACASGRERRHRPLPRPGSHPPEPHAQLHFFERNIPGSLRGAARPPFWLLPGHQLLSGTSLLASHHSYVCARPMPGTPWAVRSMPRTHRSQHKAQLNWFKFNFAWVWSTWRIVTEGYISEPARMNSQREGKVRAQERNQKEK